MIFLWDSFCLSAVSLSRQWHDILDFSYCFACDIGQLAKIWIWVSSEVITICISGMWISVDQLFTWYLASPCWRDPTRSKQLSTVANLGFQFGLYRVVASLSFLRSISLASLFNNMYFLLDLLRKLTCTCLVVWGACLLKVLTEITDIAKRSGY